MNSHSSQFQDLQSASAIMPSKKELEELCKELSWLLSHMLNISESRTVAEQFDRTKKISDFIGFLTRLMFLAAVQAVITNAIDNSAAPQKVLYALVVALLFVIQVYFSYSISFIVTKTIMKSVPEKLGIDMSFRIGMNRETVIFFSALIFLQTLYFGVNSALQTAVSRDSASITDQKK